MFDEEKVELELWMGRGWVTTLIHPEEFDKLEDLGYGYRYLDEMFKVRCAVDLEPQFLNE